MPDVFIKRENLDTETDMHRGRWCEDPQGENGHVIAVMQLPDNACQGLPGNQKLEEAKKVSPWEPPESAALPSPWFPTLSPQNHEKKEFMLF